MLICGSGALSNVTPERGNEANDLPCLRRHPRFARLVLRRPECADGSPLDVLDESFELRIDGLVLRQTKAVHGGNKISTLLWIMQGNFVEVEWWRSPWRRARFLHSAGNLLVEGNRGDNNAMVAFPGGGEVDVVGGGGTIDISHGRLVTQHIVDTGNSFARAGPCPSGIVEGIGSAKVCGTQELAKQGAVARFGRGLLCTNTIRQGATDARVSVDHDPYRSFRPATASSAHDILKPIPPLNSCNLVGAFSRGMRRKEQGTVAQHR